MSDKLPPRILVVEHDESINSSLCNTIERYWFDVARVKNSGDALRVAQVNPPHVVIISSRIQDISALEMAARIRRIKELKSLPIVFLLDQSELKEHYNSIDTTYVEFLTRPFTPNELMIVIRSLLRKAKPTFQDKIIKYDDITMDLSTFKVQHATKQVHLGPTEFKILQLLLQKPHTVYSRRQIMDYAWGTESDIAHRTIDVHINRIRTLMRLDTNDRSLIKTIRSEGYRLD